MEAFQGDSEALTRQLRRLTAYLESSPNAAVGIQVQSLEAAIQSVHQMHQTLADGNAALQAEREAFSQLPQLREDLSARDADVKTRLSDVEKREAALELLAEREAAANQRDASLQAAADQQRAAFDAREVDLTSREEEYELRAGEFNARGAVQAEQAADLHEKLELVGERIATLNMREDNLDKRDVAVAAREAAATAREADADARKGTQDRREEALGSWENALILEEERLANRKSKLDDQEDRINEDQDALDGVLGRETQVDNREALLEERTKWLDTRESRIINCEADLARRETSVRDSHAAQQQLLREGLDSINTRLEEVQLVDSSAIDFQHSYFVTRQQLERKEWDLEQADSAYRQLSGEYNHLTLRVTEEQADNAHLCDELQVYHDENIRLKLEADNSAVALGQKTNELFVQESKLKELREQLEVQTDLAKRHEEQLLSFHHETEIGETPEPTGGAASAAAAAAAAGSPELGSISLQAQPSESQSIAQGGGGDDEEASASAQSELFPDAPRKRQRRNTDYTHWGVFCDDVHDFLFWNRPIIRDNALGNPTLEEAGQHLVQAAASRQSQQNLNLFTTSAPQGDWYCFKRLIQVGHNASGARIEYDGPCIYHGKHESCFQVMRGAEKWALEVQMVEN